MTSYAKPKRAAWLLVSFKRFLVHTKILDKLEEQPHDEMIAEMEKCIPDFSARRQKRKLYLAPRFSFKTSIAVAFVVYLILRFPDISISIYRASQILSKDMIRAVKDILQRNPEILSTFGDLSIDAPLWTTFKFTVNTRTRTGDIDPTVAVFGLKSSMAGTHPDFVLMDDVVTEVNCDSIVEMQKAEKLVESSFPVLPMWGSLLITGTAWSAIDVYWKIRQKNQELRDADKEIDFEEYIRTVWVRDPETGEDKLFFPGFLTEEFLERQRETCSPRMYAAWYFQEVRELGMAPFPKDTIKLFDGIYERQPYPNLRVQVDDTEQWGEPIPIYCALITDPALTAAASSDNFGNNVVGWDSQKNWWVLESQEWRKLPSDAATSLIRLIATYEPHCWLLEAQNADPEMVQIVTDFIRKSGLRTVVRSYSALQDEPSGKQGKAQRILALEPKFRMGRVRLRRRHCSPLLRQLDNYPSLEHDDVLDSLAMGRKLEIHAPRFEKLEIKEDDREPKDLFHAKLDEMEVRPPGSGPLSGVARGAWTGPMR